jgi:hypothetical protein
LVERRRGLRDLVEEERPAARFLEEPLPELDRAGERALHVAEELALQQGLGDGGAVHRDERPGRSLRVRVDGAGDQLLAGSALAGDEHGDVGRSDADHPREQLTHRRGPTDQVVQLVSLAELVGEQPHVDEEPAPLERALDAHQELALLERLVQVIAGPHLHGLDGALDRAVAGHHDHLRRGRHFQRAAQHGKAVERRHLEIGEHDVERLRQQPRERAFPAVRVRDFVALLAEDERGGGAHVPLVVDDEDARPRPRGVRRRRNGDIGRRHES